MAKEKEQDISFEELMLPDDFFGNDNNENNTDEDNLQDGGFFSELGDDIKSIYNSAVNGAIALTRGVSSGFFLDNDDELSGALVKITGGDYRKQQEEADRQKRYLRDKYPAMYGIGNLAGNVASYALPITRGAGLIAKGASKVAPNFSKNVAKFLKGSPALSSVAKEGTLGAVQGGVQSVGDIEGSLEDSGQVYEKLKEGAIFGGLVGGGLSTIGAVGSKGFNALLKKPKVKKDLDKIQSVLKAALKKMGYKKIGDKEISHFVENEIIDKSIEELDMQSSLFNPSEELFGKTKDKLQSIKKLVENHPKAKDIIKNAERLLEKDPQSKEVEKFLMRQLYSIKKKNLSKENIKFFEGLVSRYADGTEKLLLDDDFDGLAELFGDYVNFGGVKKKRISKELKGKQETDNIAVKELDSVLEKEAKQELDITKKSKKDAEIKSEDISINEEIKEIDDFIDNFSLKDTERKTLQKSNNKGVVGKEEKKIYEKGKEKGVKNKKETSSFLNEVNKQDVFSKKWKEKGVKNKKETEDLISEKEKKLQEILVSYMKEKDKKNMIKAFETIEKLDKLKETVSKSESFKQLGEYGLKDKNKIVNNLDDNISLNEFKKELNKDTIKLQDTIKESKSKTKLEDEKIIKDFSSKYGVQIDKNKDDLDFSKIKNYIIKEREDILIDEPKMKKKAMQQVLHTINKGDFGEKGVKDIIVGLEVLKGNFTKKQKDEISKQLIKISKKKKDTAKLIFKEKDINKIFDDIGIERINEEDLAKYRTKKKLGSFDKTDIIDIEPSLRKINIEGVSKDDKEYLIKNYDYLVNYYLKLREMLKNDRKFKNTGNVRTSGTTIFSSIGLEKLFLNLERMNNYFKNINKGNIKDIKGFKNTLKYLKNKFTPNRKEIDRLVLETGKNIDRRFREDE